MTRSPLILSRRNIVIFLYFFGPIGMYKYCLGPHGFVRRIGLHIGYKIGLSVAGFGPLQASSSRKERLLTLP